MVTLSEGDKFHVRGRHLLGLSEGDKFHVAIPETTLIHSFVHPTRTDKVKVSTYGLVIGEHIKVCMPNCRCTTTVKGQGQMQWRVRGRVRVQVPRR